MTQTLISVHDQQPTKADDAPGEAGRKRSAPEEEQSRDRSSGNGWFALAPGGKKLRIPKELRDALFEMTKQPRGAGEIKIDYFEGEIHEIEYRYCRQQTLKKRPTLRVCHPRLNISVDRRLELLSIVFRLAGRLEKRKTPIAGYHEDIDKHFCRLADHPVVTLVRSLSQENKGLTSLMSMGVHLSQTPELSPVFPFANCSSQENAVRFAELLRDFYGQSDFETFFASHESLYTTARRQLGRLLRGSFHPSWFHLFYARRPQGAINILLGMTDRGTLAPRVRRADGTQDICLILGTRKINETGVPIYDSDDLNRIIRELNYLFLYPLVDDCMRNFGSAERIYAKIREKLCPRAYSNARSMVYESLARAARTQYFESHGEDRDSIQARILHDQSRGFLWMDELCTLLREYDSKRASYHNFVSFMGEVKKFFGLFAKYIDEAIANFQQNPAFRESSPSTNQTQQPQ